MLIRKIRTIISFIILVKQCGLLGVICLQPADFCLNCSLKTPVVHQIESENFIHIDRESKSLEELSSVPKWIDDIKACHEEAINLIDRNPQISSCKKAFIKNIPIFVRFSFFHIGICPCITTESSKKMGIHISAWLINLIDFSVQEHRDIIVFGVLTALAHFIYPEKLETMIEASSLNGKVNKIKNPFNYDFRDENKKSLYFALELTNNLNAAKNLLSIENYCCELRSKNFKNSSFEKSFTSKKIATEDPCQCKCLNIYYNACQKKIIEKNTLIDLYRKKERLDLQTGMIIVL